MSQQSTAPICFNQKEYENLVLEICKLDEAYYVNNEAVVPDAEYDRLMRKLRMTEERMKWSHPDSPTQRVSGRVADGFKEVTHVLPMLSLDNIFDLEELREKLQKAESQVGKLACCPWVVEPKIDGLSMNLVYENGVLTQAITRGNGVVGEDVLNNARTIRNLPLRLKNAEGVALAHVRGEVFISFRDFQEINKQRAAAGLELFANPRNAAAGGIRSHDPAEAAKRRLSFLPYGIAVVNTGTDIKLKTQENILGVLSKWGFAGLPGLYVCTNVQEEVVAAINEFEHARKNLPFPTDGAVIKLNSVAHRAELGNSNKAPKWAWAYKYAPEEVETVLNAISLQVGKSGIVAPVAELQPVDVAGSLISRATLHNADEIARKDIRVGDVVTIAKAGEVIPMVIGPVLKHRTDRQVPFVMPTTCPSCATKLVKAQNEDGEGVAWKCPNTWECRDQGIARLQHWCGKEAMDIEDVGPEVAQGLYESGFKRPTDLYIEEYFSGAILVNLETWGIKGQTLKNLTERIDASRAAGMERIIVGLAIPQIGRSLARKAAAAFPDLNLFFGAAMEGTLSAKMPEFGKAKIKALESWMKEPWPKLVIPEICDGSWLDIKSKSYNPEAANGPLAGKTFVFTGNMFKMERDAAHRLVESKGGKATGSVSKKTTYLVAGSECGATKMKKATDLGVTVLTEDEFLKMVGE
jgi:DNA ligase (NAD+)